MEELKRVLETLDQLALVLADVNHIWTNAERTNYQKSIKYILSQLEPPVILLKASPRLFTVDEVKEFLEEQRMLCRRQRYIHRYNGVEKMEDGILNAPLPHSFLEKVKSSCEP